MFGINEILSKVISRKPLTKEEKFKVLHSKKIDPKVVKYLLTKLNDLYIEVLDKYEGTLFELMPVGKFESWCWQTTESAIVFLNDSDYIERGFLYFDENTPYYHSWACFDYNGKEYVLDPCLNFLCQKNTILKYLKLLLKGKFQQKLLKKN